MDELYRKTLDHDRREHLGETYKRILYLDEVEHALAYLLLRDPLQKALLLLQ